MNKTVVTDKTSQSHRSSGEFSLCVFSLKRQSFKSPLNDQFTATGRSSKSHNLPPLFHIGEPSKGSCLQLTCSILFTVETVSVMHSSRFKGIEVISHTWFAPTERSSQRSSGSLLFPCQTFIHCENINGPVDVCSLSAFGTPVVNPRTLEVSKEVD